MACQDERRVRLTVVWGAIGTWHVGAVQRQKLCAYRAEPRVVCDKFMSSMMEGEQICVSCCWEGVFQMQPYDDGNNEAGSTWRGHRRHPLPHVHSGTLPH